MYRDRIYTGFYVSGHVSEGHSMYRKTKSMYRKNYKKLFIN